MSVSSTVPSGYVTSQNIRTTLPLSGRHGKRESVVGSGRKNKSERTSPPKPAIAEASMAMPCSKARSSSFGIIATFFCSPYTSQNARRINFTSSSLTYWRTSATVKFIYSPSLYKNEKTKGSPEMRAAIPCEHLRPCLKFITLQQQLSIKFFLKKFFSLLDKSKNRAYIMPH